MLLRIGPRLRSLSRIAAPSEAVASPVAKPCSARAAIKDASEPAVVNIAMETMFRTSAARMAGRRPIKTTGGPPGGKAPSRLQKKGAKKVGAAPLAANVMAVITATAVVVTFDSTERGWVSVQETQRLMACSIYSGDGFVRVP